jgi:hypothetical protein
MCCPFLIPNRELNLSLNIISVNALPYYPWNILVWGNQRNRKLSVGVIEADGFWCIPTGVDT